jgi:hypothetical protein
MAHLKLDCDYTPEIIRNCNITVTTCPITVTCETTSDFFQINLVRDESLNIAQCKYSIAPDRATVYLTDIWTSDKTLGSYLLYLLGKDAQLRRYHNIIVTDPSHENRRLYASVGFRFCPKTHKIYLKTQKLLSNTQFLMFIDHVRTSNTFNSDRQY